MDIQTYRFSEGFTFNSQINNLYVLSKCNLLNFQQTRPLLIAMWEPVDSSQTLQNYIPNGDAQSVTSQSNLDAAQEALIKQIQQKYQARIKLQQHDHVEEIKLKQNRISQQCNACQSINQLQRQENISQEQCAEQQKYASSSSRSESSASSSHDYGELVQPLHQHIVTHSRQIQETIANLQLQIQKLKRTNQEKQVIIKELQSQLKKPKVQKNYEVLAQSHLQIQNLKKQILRLQKQKHYSNKKNTINPRETVIQSIQSLESGTFKQIQSMRKNFESKLKGRHKEKSSQKLPPHPSNNGKKVIQYSRRIVTDSFDQKNTELADQQKYNSFVQINQKQNFKKQEKLRASLELQVQKCQRLEKHVQACEEEMVWMTNFIVGFLRMGERIAAKWGERIYEHSWGMKKKTKNTWRYFKHVLDYIFKVLEFGS